MFRFLNKIIKYPVKKDSDYSRRGQAAIVLILIIAVALIFYAASLNFGKLSGTKAFSTAATDSSAAMLASGMTSYAQSLSMTYLDGRLAKKGWAGFFAALISIIIIVVSIITLQPQGVALALTIIGTALAVTSAVLQAAVVNPSITESWNRIINETLSTSDQIIENSLQTALSKVITDSVLVDDLTDADIDRVWVSETGTGTGIDKISRFSAYYARRLTQSEGGPTAAVKSFMDALDKLVFVRGPDDWGIHDPYNPEECFGRSECHPCCLPLKFEDARIRPEWCDLEHSDDEWREACAQASSYGEDYPWVYDPADENPLNNGIQIESNLSEDGNVGDIVPGFSGIVSFRERIGQDDEHPGFYKDNANTSPTTWDPNRVPQNEHDENRNDEGYYLEDATNYYIASSFKAPLPAVPDYRPGAHPWYHKMSSWGIDLNDPELSDTALNPRYCHWCDPNYGSPCSFCLEAFEGPHPTGPHPHPHGEIPHLALPLDPASLEMKQTYIVDGDTDVVSFPEYIFAKPNDCAEDALYPEPKEIGFWKPGTDRFCSDTWPYHLDCSKHQSDDVPCRDSSNKDQFNEDVVDNIYYGLGDFVVWAKETLKSGREQLVKLAVDLPLWYPDVARYIEGGDTGCFLCNLEDPPEGFLQVWLKEMREIVRLHKGWKDNFGEGYVGENCEDAWCVPAVDACPLVQEDEEQTFDFYETRVRGDIPSIIECLRWNIEGTGSGPLANGAGNAERFQNCFDACDACRRDVTGAACTDAVNEVCGAYPDTYMPRPILDFDIRDSKPSSIDISRTGPVHVKEIEALRTCPSFCSECLADCDAAGSEDDECNEACSEEFEACKQKCIDDLTDCKEKCPEGDSGCDQDCRGAQSLCLTGPEGCNVKSHRCHDECPDISNECAKNCTCDDKVFQTVCEHTPGGPWEEDCHAGCNCVPKPLNCLTEVCNGAPDDPSGCLKGVTAGTVLADKVQEAKGICENNDPDSWLDKVERSIPLAYNQVEKFKKRHSVLTERNLWNNYIIQTFEQATREFETFLRGPAADLVNARREFNPNAVGLPNDAIYGWRGDPPKDGSSPVGKWHIVKVEGRIPGNCDGACGADQVSSNDEWPRIKTRTYAWGTRREYRLINTDGSVKFRTIRYDEGSESDSLLFPNGLPIWQFRSGQSGNGEGPDPSALNTVCAASAINFLSDGTQTDNYKGAFMITRQSDNPACWNLAHELLSQGFVSETCAVYGWHGSESSGRMNFRFVPCQEF